MHIELIAIKLHVNLYSMIVTNKDGLVKVVQQAASNDRKLRKRPDNTLKSDAFKLHKSKIADKFADCRCQYGMAWAEKYKPREDGRHDRSQPTPNEMVEGLMKWLTRQIE